MCVGQVPDLVLIGGISIDFRDLVNVLTLYVFTVHGHSETGLPTISVVCFYFTKVCWSEVIASYTPLSERVQATLPLVSTGTALGLLDVACRQQERRRRCQGDLAGTGV